MLHAAAAIADMGVRFILLPCIALSDCCVLLPPRLASDGAASRLCMLCIARTAGHCQTQTTCHYISSSYQHVIHSEDSCANADSWCWAMTFLTCNYRRHTYMNWQCLLLACVWPPLPYCCCCYGSEETCSSFHLFGAKHLGTDGRVLRMSCWCK